MSSNREMDFVVVGVPKCGTSWLDFALRKKIAYAMPQHSKETFYYDKRYSLGKAWHAGQFDPGTTRRGEVSPSYFSNEDAIARLKSESPECKIIIMLRNPYERAVSAILHHVRRGAYLPNSIEAVPPEIWEAVRRYNAYSIFGPAWQDAFGQKNVLYVSYDDVSDSPMELLNRVLEHAGFAERFDRIEAEEISGNAVFKAAVPRSALIARGARTITGLLEKAGLEGIAGWARRSPVRRLIEKSPSSVSSFQDSLREHICQNENYEIHVDYAELVLSAKLPHWRAVS